MWQVEDLFLLIASRCQAEKPKPRRCRFQEGIKCSHFAGLVAAINDFEWVAAQALQTARWRFTARPQKTAPRAPGLSRVATVLDEIERVQSLTE